MASNFAIGAIGSLFAKLFGLIDDMHTSEEEKLEAQRSLLETQTGMVEQWLDHEKAVIESQAKIVMAEAQGESWLQRNWRPMTMLAFCGMVGAHWFGFTPENMSESTIEGLFLLVQLGLGGYVVGRSAEKVTKELVKRESVDG